MRVNRHQTVETPAAILLHNGEPFTGELEDTDTGGRTIALTSYVNGLEHGPQTEWYPTGEKHVEGRCDQGCAVGEWREWHRNGKLAEQSLFNKFGELVELRRWDENGVLVEERLSGVTRGL
ncbi:hypothetical protein BBK82_24195 [Lentzea guizhouensis]|uniref:MORN repeat variant n=1 Tax=Lentzea guizhouensis TaxID=1586287 RepID=A0A1B2HZ13_9PSEU|nr:hypothetical protein BBK82_24195 [Lentzea guizhouensis]